MKTNAKLPFRRKLLAPALALALILCSCLSAVSCAEGDPDLPAGMQIASGEEKNFKLYVPKTWVVNSADGYSSAYFSQSDPSNVSMMAYITEESITLGEYIDEYFAKYSSQFPETVLISRDEDELDGYEAERIVFTTTVSGVEYKFLQIIAGLGDFYYIFTYTAKIENYDTHMVEVELIADNIKFN